MLQIMSEVQGMDTMRSGRFRYVGSLFFVLVLSFVLTGCDSDDTKANNGDVENDANPLDTGVEVDSGTKTDVGGLADTGPMDADVSVDADESDGTITAKCTDDGHAAGDKYPAGDGCNYCVCNEDGSTTCTERTCSDVTIMCEHNGDTVAYGERFASADGCNECVCGVSGLACTKRAACPGEAPEESAILLESLDEPCGSDATFTAGAVLAELPRREITAPFLYDRGRTLYMPETLDDTTVTIRIDHDDSFHICRLESETISAIDIGVVVEWTTADGALNEGFKGYLRRSDFRKFVDSWVVHSVIPFGQLNGSYVSHCMIPTPPPGPYLFSVTVNADGSAGGGVGRVCEGDIGLTMGQFELPAL